MRVNGDLTIAPARLERQLVRPHFQGPAYPGESLRECP